MTTIIRTSRIALTFVVAAALGAPLQTRAENAAASAPASAAASADNPLAQQVADQFVADCRKTNAASMTESIRQDAGPDASPGLLAEMVAVGEEAVCGCFGDALRAQPDAGILESIDHMEPQFNTCMAAAIKPRMARICSEAQLSQTDATAPDCTCLAEAVAKLDDTEIGKGANDLFDVLRSTRDMPVTAGALGAAARGCAKTR